VSETNNSKLCIKVENRPKNHTVKDDVRALQTKAGHSSSHGNKNNYQLSKTLNTVKIIRNVSVELTKIT